MGPACAWMWLFDKDRRSLIVSSQGRRCSFPPAPITCRSSTAKSMKHLSASTGELLCFTVEQGIRPT